MISHGVSGARENLFNPKSDPDPEPGCHQVGIRVAPLKSAV